MKAITIIVRLLYAHYQFISLTHAITPIYPERQLSYALEKIPSCPPKPLGDRV